MGDTFFITTAIDYTNAAPHIGHAYEKVLADVLARYRRLKGDDVFFLTGVDQHGQKVQQSAEKLGVEPQAFVDGVTAKFTALWDKLDVRYDAWAATTDARHKDCVRAILDRLNREGQIYKDKRGGYYSVRQEQFLTDKERNEAGEFGPEWGQVEFREEENYYFKLAEHKAWLLAAIDSGKLKVVPDFRTSELRNAVEKLEGDLCISRPRARLSWGIPFPFDEEYVTYVWFDALVNYISFAPGYDPAPARPPEEFLRRWRTVTHVIGKDILIPAHGVYWPIMLKALGFADDELPTLLVHGWWNVSGAKMSKSLGNVVDPDALADKYGAEALRYYLMADIATGFDADFDQDWFVARYNSELANGLGNLLNRAISMANRYRQGRLIRGLHDEEILQELRAFVPAPLLFGYALNLDRGEVDGPLQLVFGRFERVNLQPQANQNAIVDPRLSEFRAFGFVQKCNFLVEYCAPWKLAKDPIQADRLDAVLYHLAESLRIIAILISPVLPKAAAGIFAQLNWTGPMTLAEAEWGKLPDGHQLGQPTPLFPRIETEKAS